jgi:predicted N-acetyltransferase YhbS
VSSPVRRISSVNTHALRRSVLRNDAEGSMAFEGDEDLDTLHLGFFDNNDCVIGICSFMRRPLPEQPDVQPAVQLRGMAVSPQRRASGIGASLFTAALEILRDEGVALLWANARDSALGFYVDRFAMTAADTGFIDPTTTIAHHRVWLDLQR